MTMVPRTLGVAFPSEASANGRPLGLRGRNGGPVDRAGGCAALCIPGRTPHVAASWLRPDCVCRCALPLRLPLRPAAAPCRCALRWHTTCDSSDGKCTAHAPCSVTHCALTGRLEDARLGARHIYVSRAAPTGRRSIRLPDSFSVARDALLPTPSARCSTLPTLPAVIPQLERSRAVRVLLAASALPSTSALLSLVSVLVRRRRGLRAHCAAALSVRCHCAACALWLCCHCADGSCAGVRKSRKYSEEGEDAALSRGRSLGRPARGSAGGPGSCSGLRLRCLHVVFFDLRQLDWLFGVQQRRWGRLGRPSDVHGAGGAPRQAQVLGV